MLRIAREGYPFILLPGVIAIIFTGLSMFWLSAPFFLLALFMIYFFRDPERVINRKDGVFYSPADGKVIFIGKVGEDELLKDKAIEVSIFMSPFNVHINRIPCDGVVRDVRHCPGKFYAAYREDSSIANEHITMLIEGRHGKVVVRQVAGFLARRAVCRVKPGDTLTQGQRYGMIKFSSRVDIYLPLNTNIEVKLNDKVKAGETIIGVIGSLSH
jgi:phosphatidylserine decarboxylase